MGTALWGGTLPVLHPQGVQGSRHVAQVRGSWRLSGRGSVILGLKRALLFDGILNHDEDLLSLRRLEDERAGAGVTAASRLDG